MARAKLYQAYVNAWQSWRDEGREPRSRTKAIEIIKRELAALGVDVQSAHIRDVVARDHESEEGTVLNASLSFLVWDLVENDGKALDYSVDRNYFDGLFEQARLAISLYTRFTIKTQGIGKITMPQYVSVRGAGQQPVRNLTRAQLESIVNREIQDAQQRMRRWKALGASRRLVQTKLNELATIVLADFEGDKEVAA